MSETLVVMEGIDKSFPGVHALDQAHFELRPGEVHALVGENGAGKSTLMKILSGVYRKDAGRIYYRGQEVDIPNPRAAQDLGISIIHQELNLMPHLTVAQNIFIGREPRRGVRFLVDDDATNKKAEQLFEMMHLKLNPRTKVADLTVAMQQMVEIAKALSFNSEVLIMDEPTAALTESEIDDLFRIVRQLRAKGVGIVHISHRLEELKQISDRITVMRDSRTIDTVNTKEVTIDQIISLMVGRTIFESTPELPERPSQDIALEVKGLNRGRVLRDINFRLKKGEILGFAGLMGAGRTEVARAIFGADPYDSGQMVIKGQSVQIRHPRDAVRHGIAYLSEDRKRYGLALGLACAAQAQSLRLLQDSPLPALHAQRGQVVVAVTLPGAGSLAVDALLLHHTNRTHKTAQEHVQALAIKTPGLRQRVRNLSGGNQQKVIVGKWLTADTDILIFDEPTRGIDVGAKSEIYRNSTHESSHRGDVRGSDHR